VVEPARIEAALAMLASLEQPRVAREQRWQQRRERARDEVARTAVLQPSEPANRLVARALATQWNTALPTVQAVEQDSVRAQARMLAPLSAPARALIAHVVPDLPGVWHAPTTTSAD
jgi:hypothetical protein